MRIAPPRNPKAEVIEKSTLSPFSSQCLKGKLNTDRFSLRTPRSEIEDKSIPPTQPSKPQEPDLSQSNHVWAVVGLKCDVSELALVLLLCHTLVADP